MNGDGQRRRGSWLYAPLGMAFFLALATAGLLVIGLVESMGQPSVGQGGADGSRRFRP